MDPFNYFEHLQHLRSTGQVDIFNVHAKFREKYPELTEEKAKNVVRLWMFLHPHPSNTFSKERWRELTEESLLLSAQGII